MSSQNDQLLLEYRALIEKHKADPQAFQTNFDLGMFMSRYRQLMTDAIQFLVRAFSLVPTNEHRKLLLERLYLTFGYAGDSENELKAIQTLAHEFPQNLWCVEQYANTCISLGMTKEVDNLINSTSARNYDCAVNLMKNRGSDTVRQFVADSDELFDAFGEMAYRFDLYIKARILGLTPPAYILCRSFQISSGYEIANPFLLELWKTQATDYIEFIASAEEWDKLKITYAGCGVLLTKIPLPEGVRTSAVSPRNYIYNRWYDEGRAPLLRLPEETAHRGRKWLADLGMPNDAWFVCLHVRDGGYKADADDGYNKFRNCNAQNYFDAVHAITELGGWVVRIGNPSPVTMNDLPHVIDYANHPDQADWKDIFLLSQCRFFIGSNSGPVCAAQVFGVPTVTTDMFPVGLIWGTPQDLVIHKLLRRIDDGTYLPISEAAVHGVGSEHTPVFYAKHGLTVEDNTPEEITAVAIEMISRLEGKWQPAAADMERQAQYSAQFTLAPNQVRVNIGKEFLERHSFLLTP